MNEHIVINGKIYLTLTEFGYLLGIISFILWILYHFICLSGGDDPLSHRIFFLGLVDFIIVFTIVFFIWGVSYEM